MSRVSRETRAGTSPQRWTWLVPIIALACVAWVWIIDPPAVQSLRNAVFDQYQRWSPRTYVDAPVRIVDIDDESLRRLGQWPWPRTRMAALVSEMHRLGAASIALDIVLAEPDRTTPNLLLQDRDAPADVARYVESLPDHDRVFADALALSNAAIGFALTNDPRIAPLDDDLPDVPMAKAGYLSIGDSPLPNLPHFSAGVPSLRLLQQAAAGHGALTFIPDTDGVIRRVPLFAELAGAIVPSLSAEALRLAEGARNYTIRSASSGGGIIDLVLGHRVIPTSAEGAMWVHYTRPTVSRYIPAWKVLAHKIPVTELDGRIGLIGTSAQGLMDLRFSPLGGVVPGVEIHAQAIEQVLLNTPLLRPGWAPAVEWMAALIGGLVVGLIAIRHGAVVSATTFVVLAGGVCVAAWQAFVGWHLLLEPATTTLAMLAVFLPSTAVRHILSERRQRWVKEAFSRYVSPNLVDYLIANPGALELGGKRQRCSFVFSDLAGFTTLMESMQPMAAVKVLNGYLDRMIAIAFEHGGTLDRIVGDSVAIVFSAPVEQADHEQRALRCALAMQRFAHAYLVDLAAQGIAFCATRIGVHTGDVTVGNFGGNTIFDYRALGDPVNTASRLEGANKYLGTLVCVSEATLSRCPGALARPIGRLVLAGRIEPVMAYEPFIDNDRSSAPAVAYLNAFDLMSSGREDAVDAFRALERSWPEDRLVQMHSRRLAAGQRGDVIVLEHK